MEDSLHEFIRKALDQGQTTDQIQQELLAVGWETDAVSRAIQDVLTAPVVSRTYLPVQDIYSPNTSAPVNTTYSFPKTATKGSFAEVKIKPTTQIVRKFLPVKMAMAVASFVLIASGVIGGTYFYINGRSSSQIADNNSQNGTEQGNNSGVQQNITANANDAGYSRFTNREYGFSVNIPKTWSVKDFEQVAFGNEKRFAFGLVNDLPQEVFNQGNYVWLKIYSVENRTSYEDFLYLKSLIGNNQGVEKGVLGGVQGIKSSDFVAAENKGRIYELHLIQLFNELEESLYLSPESEEILRSFTFD